MSHPGGWTLPGDAIILGTGRSNNKDENISYPGIEGLKHFFPYFLTSEVLQSFFFIKMFLKAAFDIKKIGKNLKFISLKNTDA